jgi:hypothetical protein
MALAAGLATLTLIAAASAVVGAQNVATRYERLEPLSDIHMEPPFISAGFHLVRGDTITIFAVESAGEESPIPPGIVRLPRAGEYYVSPAARVLGEESAEWRWLAEPTGEISHEGLRRPDELVAWVGVSELSRESSSLVGFGGGSRPELLSLSWLPFYVTMFILFVVVPLFALVRTSFRGATSALERQGGLLEAFGVSRGRVVKLSMAAPWVSAMLGAAGGCVVWGLLHRGMPDQAFGLPVFAEDFDVPPLTVVLVSVAVFATVGISTTTAFVRALSGTITARPGIARPFVSRWPMLWMVLGLLLFGALQLGRPSVSGPAGGGVWYVATIAMAYGLLTGLAPMVASLGRGLARNAKHPALLIAGRFTESDPGTVSRLLAPVGASMFAVLALVPLNSRLAPSDELIEDVSQYEQELTAHVLFASGAPPNFNAHAIHARAPDVVVLPVVPLVDGGIGVIVESCADLRMIVIADECPAAPIATQDTGVEAAAVRLMSADGTALVLPSPAVVILSPYSILSSYGIVVIPRQLVGSDFDPLPSDSFLAVAPIDGTSRETLRALIVEAAPMIAVESVAWRTQTATSRLQPLFTYLLIVTTTGFLLIVATVLNASRRARVWFQTRALSLRLHAVPEEVIRSSGVLSVVVPAGVSYLVGASAAVWASRIIATTPAEFRRATIGAAVGLIVFVVASLIFILVMLAPTQHTRSARD